MKNLLVAGSVNSTVTDITKLTKGSLAIVSSNGSLLKGVPTYSTTNKRWEATLVGASAATEVPSTYKYVVGLANGKRIEGCTIDASSKTVTKQVYNPGAIKKVTVQTVNIDLSNIGEATLHIHTQAKNSLSGQDFQEFVATVPIYSTTQDEASIKNALLAKAKEVIVDINKYFGVDVLAITKSDADEGEATALETACFRAKSTDFNFNVSFGGAVRGTVSVSNTLSFGTQAEVIKLEKEMAIVTFGYNPNFEAGDHAYGDVFLASDYGADGYDIHVISSVVPATDQMPLNAGGAKVEQRIALPTGTAFTA